MDTEILIYLPGVRNKCVSCSQMGEMLVTPKSRHNCEEKSASGEKRDVKKMGEEKGGDTNKLITHIRK